LGGKTRIVLKISSIPNDRDMNQNEKAIAALLANYQEALNQSDTNSVMKLYASDGVFMLQHSPSSVGADAIRKAYDAVFNTIKLDVDFKRSPKSTRLAPTGLLRAPTRPGRSWSRRSLPFRTIAWAVSGQPSFPGQAV
jgi:hypothetical protein